MFSIVDHLPRWPGWARLRSLVLGRFWAAWSLLLRIAGKRPGPLGDVEGKDVQEPPTPRTRFSYIPVQGSWRRRERPDLPDSVFQIPENVPSGHIYYYTKGWQVGFGATAHVERLPSGHIVKYPTPNPYLPSEEESHRANMCIEAEVYRRVGDCPFILKLIDWDPETCCLTIEHLERRDLGMYMRGYDEAAPDLVGVTVIPLQVRKRWTLQAASGLAALHAVEVIHCDVTPRNFLLSGDLDLYIADFAGSSIDGSAATVAPSPRYLPPGWSWSRKVEKADDVFALGSVFYFIMEGAEPYADLEEDEVEKLFQDAKFPCVDHLICGSVIRQCWERALTAEQVVDALTALYGSTPRSSVKGPSRSTQP